MKLSTVEKIAHKLFSSSLLDSNLQICWHLGEPLVRCISFYEEAIQIFAHNNKQNVNIQHAIQTNGLLINKDWCNFFSNYNIVLGISIDGPKIVHNKNRKDRRDKGTFDLLRRKISMVQNHNIDLRVLTVISSKSLNYAKEIFDFFLRENIKNVALDVVANKGCHNQKENKSYKKYRDFFEEIYALYCQYRDQINIREFEKYEYIASSNSNMFDYNISIHPFQVLTCNHKGNFSTFSPEMMLNKEVPFFNEINSSKITSELSQVTNQIISGIDKCKASCQYYDLCGGGSPSIKYSEHGTFDESETEYCKIAVKCMVDAMIKHLLPENDE